MQKPKLSFIIPVFSPDIPLLRRVIKALIEQSCKDFEVIFVMDGENKTAEKAIFLGTENANFPTQILYQDHKGAPAARNLGLSKAIGDFLVCWDCDCVIAVETAKTWLDMFDQYPDIGFVYSGYEFLDEMGAIDSQEFDPWSLKIRNYISACFPVRREFAGKWDSNLKSLQDWDWWLQAVEKGARGKYLKGYAFSTSYPNPDSISGKGCLKENWLERVNAVKKKHNISHKDTCVTSLTQVSEGRWLAKLIGADFQEMPNFKPHDYKRFIFVGFCMIPPVIQENMKIFDDPDTEKIIILTSDDITQITTKLNLRAIWKYSDMLRNTKVFVEDKEGQQTLERAGFKVKVRPLPLVSEDPPELPKKMRFAVDCAENYNQVVGLIEKSLPDVELVNLTGVHRVGDFSGLLHLHPDKTVSVGMRRMVMAGRPVVSNVQAPFMGFCNDKEDLSEFIPEVVNKVRREARKKNLRLQERDFYTKTAGPGGFLDAIKKG